jgi:hypothetical protein
VSPAHSALTFNASGRLANGIKGAADAIADGCARLGAPASVPSRESVLANRTLLLHVLWFLGVAELVRDGRYRANKLFVTLWR